MQKRIRELASVTEVVVPERAGTAFSMHFTAFTPWGLTFQGENACLAELDYFPSLVGGGTLLLKEPWAVTEHGGMVIQR